MVSFPTTNETKPPARSASTVLDGSYNDRSDTAGAEGGGGLASQQIGKKSILCSK